MTSSEDVTTPAFEDRRDAGTQLARLLLAYSEAHPLVLGLPRGGVPVAFEVATALGAPLDLFPVRKLGAPQQPELGVGAIASDGTVLLNRDAIRALNISQETLQAIVERESAELTRQLARFRGDRPPLNAMGRTVILVDDGLATGLTAAVAIDSVRAGSPKLIVLAVPVGAARTIKWLETKADRVVVAFVPVDFAAVGLWYRNFEQTSDAEVLELLHIAQERGKPLEEDI